MSRADNLRRAVTALAVIATVSAGTLLEASGESCLRSTPADCQRQSIVGVKLEDTALFGANFRGATLQDIDFSRAGLGVAVFDQATLTNVNFTDANLAGASFAGTRLAEVNFAGANLRGARFDEATISLEALESAYTCMTTMPNDTMNNSDCDVRFLGTSSMEQTKVDARM